VTDFSGISCPQNLMVSLLTQYPTGQLAKQRLNEAAELMARPEWTGGGISLPSGVRVATSGWAVARPQSVE
jgi:hypothetical protein